jgi:hypothetical protein
LFKNCTYYCHLDHKIPLSDRNNLTIVASEIYRDLFPLVPSVAYVDKWGVNNTRSGKIIGYICKQLLQDILQPQSLPGAEYTNAIDPVLVNTWGILTKTSNRYILQEPTHRNIKAAWDKISELTSVSKSKEEKSIALVKVWNTLRQPPYGYNENTFAVLCASWLSYYRSEVVISGAFGIPKNQKDKVYIQTEPIKSWVATNVFDKPKDFVQKWITVKNKNAPQIIRRKLQPVPKLPASITYTEAIEEWLPKLKSYLMNPDEAALIEDLKTQQKQLEAGIQTLKKIIDSVETTESLATEPELTAILQLNQALSTPLKPIQDSTLEIRPTDDQKARYHAARQNLRDQLNHYVERQAQQVSELNTIVDCDTFKAKLEQDFEQLRAAPDVSSRLPERLKEIQTLTEQRRDDIREGKKLESAIAFVQQQHHALSSNATQNDYATCQRTLEQKAESIPALKSEESYLGAIAQITEQQNALNQQLSNWEEHYDDQLDVQRALNLTHEISTHRKRYTTEEDCDRVTQLLEKLNAIILSSNPSTPPPDPKPDLQKLEQALEAYNHKLYNLKDLIAAKTARDELLKRAIQYQKNGLAVNYESLLQATDTLIHLFELHEKTTARSR